MVLSIPRRDAVDPLLAAAPVVERLVLPKGTDPWSFVAALPLSAPAWYWHDPDAGETLAAAFAIAAGTGEPQWDAWSELVSRIREQCDGAVRLWFGGARSGADRVAATMPADRAWMVPGLTVRRDQTGVAAWLCGDAETRRALRAICERASTGSDALEVVAETRWDEIATDSCADWNARVEAVRGAIRDGRLHKAVPSRRVWFRADRVDAMHAGLRARLRRTPDRVALLVEQESGLFAAATPETLFTVAADGTLRTHALAGTLAPGATIDAFLDNARLREEHELVVADICKVLESLGLAPQAATPRVRPAGAVCHLETPILAHGADRCTPQQLRNALHPTAAIVGAPRREAAAFIDALEPFSRGWFAAPFGWTDGGRNKAVIAIRSVWLDDSGAHALVGAGIVADSEPDLEWEETERKLDNMRQMIGMVNA
ncbi:MAG: hypothetical protein D6761_12940 [Candidatus Dadabacteria bacterium]|nr:MAG: hypothetical protein D6761_12940 [Candidatus Dadabacteria bacterium]